MTIAKLNDADVRRLRSRFEKAENERLLWEGIWQRAYRYAAPQLQILNNGSRTPVGEESSGEDLNVHIYDTTLAQSTTVFASKLFNGLTPLNQKWVQFRLGDAIKEKLTEPELVKKELEELNDKIFQFIHASNFEEEMGSAYENFAIGTMAILVKFNPNNDGRPFIFESVNPQLLAIELSTNRKPENVWRAIIEKVDEIKFIWPNAKLTTNLKKILKESPDKKVTLIEGTLFQPEKNNFLHIVMEEKSEVDKGILLSEENESSPWIITRFGARANEAFGRGKALLAVHNAITLNKIVLTGLQTGFLKIAPPFMVNNADEINPNTFVIRPNALLPVLDINAIKQLEIADTTKILEFHIKNLQEQIKAIMLTSPLGPVNTPVRSATEVALRNSEVIEQNVPAVGRFIAEFYHTLFERLLFLSKAHGLVKLPKTKNLTIRQNQIKLEYTAPLMRIQEARELQALVEYTQTSQLIFGPQLAPRTLNEAKVPAYLSKLLNIPAGIVKTEKEVLEALQEATKALQEEQQQQQQAQAPQPSQTANNALTNAMATAQNVGSGIPPTGVR